MDINDGVSVTIPTDLHESVSKAAESQGGDIDSFVAKALRDLLREKYPEHYTYPIHKDFKAAFNELTDMERISLWLQTKETGISLEQLWEQKQQKHQEHLEKLAQSDETKLKSYLKSKRN